MIRFAILLSITSTSALAREGTEYSCVMDQSCLSDSPCDTLPLDLEMSFIGPFYIKMNDTLVWGMVETYADGTTIFFGWNNRLQPHHIALSETGEVTYTFGQMNQEFPESIFGGLFRGTCQETRL